MAGKTWKRAKDKDEILDYIVDWEDALNGDTIDSSTWIMPTGINKDSDLFNATRTTIWLSGGTEGQTYSMVNRVHTASLRTMDQTCKLKCKTR